MSLDRQFSSYVKNESYIIASLRRLCNIIIECDLTMAFWIHTILSKSSNRPLSFYQFSSKPYAIPQICLHSQVGEYVSTLDHQKVYHNSINCIQEAPMNTCTPIFKINKNLHWVVGLSSNILTQSDHCHAGRMFISTLICFFSHTL